MNRKLDKDTIVYVVLSPNNSKKEYRCVKCKVKTIYYRGSTQKDYVEYDTQNIPYDYRVTLHNVEDEKVFYYNKHLDKIYFEDEIPQLTEDMLNLNKILDFKQKQKQETLNYIKKEFPNWKYRGKINV